MRFTRATFDTPDGHHKGIVRSGDPLAIKLDYEVRAIIETRHFGVSLHSRTDARSTDIGTCGVGLATTHLGPGRGIGT